MAKLQDLISKYKGLLTGAGKTLSNLIPPVAAVNAIKTMKTPQWQQQATTAGKVIETFGQKLQPTIPEQYRKYQPLPLRGAEFVAGLPSAIVQSYGRTTQLLSSPQGRQQVKEGVKTLLTTKPKLTKNYVLNTISNPAVNVALDVTDFLPGGFVFGGLVKAGAKGTAKKLAKESLEKVAKEGTEKVAKAGLYDINKLQEGTIIKISNPNLSAYGNEATGTIINTKSGGKLIRLDNGSLTSISDFKPEQIKVVGRTKIESYKPKESMGFAIQSKSVAQQPLGDIKVPQISQFKDINSFKASLNPEQLKEINRYEDLSMKRVSLSRETGYKPTKLTQSEQTFMKQIEAKYKKPNISQPLSVKGVKVKTPKIETKLMRSSQEMVPVSKVLEEKVPKTIAREASIKQSLVPEAEALPDIISRDTIDVKEKIGLLDYLRTPDRVLKKMGLENESNILRKQYDKYLRELPEEINRITQWSKQVPTESSQKIFKYLDGQPIELATNELKVANEIKSYLKTWADKLGLPEDKRITNYITHIFEKDFIKKEFDPEMAKLIQNRIPGSVYDPFVEQRLGKMGYVEDVWRALDAYVKRATRKVNLDPILKQIKEKAKGMEISQYNYLKKYTQGINMRPTDLDNLLDNQIKQMFGYKFGQRPTAVLTRAGRQAVFRGTLGLNVGTALRNLTQGVNTYAKLGERYTIKGYWDLLTKGTDELKRVGALADDLIQDRNLNVKKQLLQKADKGLFVFFDTAEKINRGSAYWGAKAKALAEGLTEEQAIDYAKKIVRDTQFVFGKIDTPVALQSDVAKMLAQFQTYTLKQVEFLGEMVKNKEWAGLIRYTLGSMAVLYSVGELIGLEPKDMIPSFRIGVPPTLQTPVEIGKALLGVPDKYGNVPTTEQKLRKVGESLIPYIPGGVQIKKTIQGLTDVSQGYSETPAGRIKYPVEQTTGNYVRGGLFGRYNLPEAQNYYDQKLSPLGEKQTETFKSVEDRFEYYRGVIEQRGISKAIEEAKLDVEKTHQDITIGDKLIYWNPEKEIVSTKTIKEPTSKTTTKKSSAKKGKKITFKKVSAPKISKKVSKIKKITIKRPSKHKRIASLKVTVPKISKSKLPGWKIPAEKMKFAQVKKSARLG